jgi:hypothetical protein
LLAVLRGILIGHFYRSARSWEVVVQSSEAASFRFTHRSTWNHSGPLGAVVITVCDQAHQAIAERPDDCVNESHEQAHCGSLVDLS